MNQYLFQALRKIAPTIRGLLLALTFLSTSQFSDLAHADLQSQFPALRSIAEQGHPEAQYLVGMAYNNGVGVEKNPKEAFRWFAQSADGGDPLGAYKLGCYYAGQFDGVVAVDLDKAYQWKLVSAQSGYSLAQSDVAAQLFSRKEHAQAVYWWGLAARQGHAQSLYNLAVSYKEGSGVDKSAPLTYAFFKLSKLASEGKVNPRAQATLDEMKSSMSLSEIDQAEETISNWNFQPTALTIKAKSAGVAAQKIISSP